MYDKIIDAIIDELRIKQCIRDISKYWNFRTTGLGPALKEASEFLRSRYTENGLTAEVMTYPADDKTELLSGCKNSLVWISHSARLELYKPAEKARLICSFEEEPLCLISNSTSTPSKGIAARVVEVHSGLNDKDYEGLDVKGAIIFTSSPATSIEIQAYKRGAIGVITDSVCPPWMLTSFPPCRQPEDTPDLTMWQGFSGRKDRPPLWGFSLSPRQGRMLRDIIRESKEPVLLRASVKAELVEGKSEMVNAVLPGTDLAHEEVWVLAHSTEPGAEDNASGCCLAFEIARTLKTLIDRGVLPPLRRTIRFLHGQEGRGYLGYVASRFHELDRVVAGLAFDAVGLNLNYGAEMVLHRSPETNASYVDGLLEFLFEAIAAKPIHKFSDQTYDTFHWRVQNYAGNDAYLGESFFDIPTPQISSWPEKFYHSSWDTPDKMSEATLRRNGTIAATYLYLLATADSTIALDFANLCQRDWKRRICGSLPLNAIKKDALQMDEKCAHLISLGRHLAFQAVDALNRVRRLAPDDKALSLIIEQLCNDLIQFSNKEISGQKKLIAVRIGRAALVKTEFVFGQKTHRKTGPVFKRKAWNLPLDTVFSKEGRERLKKLRQKGGKPERIWDWINGQRNVKELHERVQFSGEIAFEVVRDYVKLLVKEGFVVKKENKRRSMAWRE